MNRERSKLYRPRDRVRTRTLVVVVTALAVLLAAAVRSTASAGPAEAPLRVHEPLEAVVADLEAFVPAYMAEQGVPGAAIALVRDGRVVWTKGFGVTSVLTGKPVTPNSTFKVASNSKVVTAYIALRLVDQGMLALDQPLDSCLSKPFMPQEEYRPLVTLRHTLSHTSGMGSTGLSRKVRFTPGAGYFYSPSGYVYTQKVLEEITGRSLEELAQELVFQPLEMAQSSFVRTPAVMAQPARGHLLALLPAIAFAVPFLIVLSVLALTALVVGRLRSRRWRISRRTALAIYGLAALPACGLSFALTGGLFGWPSTTYALLILFVWGTPLVALLLGHAVLKRRVPERPRLRKGLLASWVLVVVSVVAGTVVALGDLPGITSEAARPDAAASVRATAADLARFLIEVANPQYLSAETAVQMHTPQVSLRSDLSWGLGPGIQHSPDGDALWHGGQEFDFQSVMIIYPDLGYGAVVLTNSDFMNPGVAIEIAHRALGGRMDAIQRAALSQEFNYQGPFLEE
jgi:CubicO group peptidase (beta-lactamase class C family)